jgi:proteasome lid subunit RPN8/RPN11
MEMLAHAQSERPNECCGLLAGIIDTNLVVKRYEMVNEAASPIEYRADPRSLLHAEKDMDKLGLQVLAIYHSHPTSAPIPSRTDLERRYIADVVNYIISLQGPEPVMRGWWLSEHDYEEAAWQIVET